jgi:hypothetical protein
VVAVFDTSTPAVDEATAFVRNASTRAKTTALVASIVATVTFAVRLLKLICKASRSQNLYRDFTYHFSTNLP